MFLYEVLTIIALLAWSFIVVVLALVAGSQMWKLMDDRLAEAATTAANFETALTWDKGMRNFFLSIIAGFGAMISGAALGETASKLIGYFDSYDDKTNDEACTDGDCTNYRDTRGTGA